MKHRHLLVALCAALVVTVAPPQVFGASHAAASGTFAGVSASYITIDMNDKGIKPVLMNAGGNLVSTESVAAMAGAHGAFAAINGTYFEAYEGVPVPWGTLIKNGKLLHSSDGGAVAGITKDGRLIVDRLSFGFFGYINGEHRAIPWRINHPSPEDDAITVFTEEYGAAVAVKPGAKAAVASGGVVTQIATSDFYVPAGGFAILYNPAVVYLVDERYKVGDSLSYDYQINTQFTNAADWDAVDVAVGAGPSLIINGQITADGPAEGFFESKINTDRAGRSFIGAGPDGKIIIGNTGAATLKEAAAACQELGLTNAMCLDGGGSVALYYEGKALKAGRNVINALGFVAPAGASASAPAADAGAGSAGPMPAGSESRPQAKPATAAVHVDGESIAFEIYNINGNNYFKLRDVAAALTGGEKQFEVSWDDAANAVELLSGRAYSPVGGELSARAQTPGAQGTWTAWPGDGNIYLDGEAADITAYKINGANYFKLRDLAAILDFGVTWDAAANTIGIDTAAGYTPE